MQANAPTPATAEARRFLLPLGHVVSFATLAVVAFSLSASTAFFRFDGTFLLSVAVNQSRWMGDAGAFSANPLEGQAGAWFPTEMRLIPGFVAGRMAGDALLPAIAFAWFATEFFVATLVLGRALGVSFRGAATGAWLLALGICPFLIPTPAAERIWGNPHLLSAIAATAFAMAAFLKIDGRRRHVDAGFAAIATLLLGYLAIAQPITTAMAWPAFGFFAAAWTWLSPAGRVRRARLLALTVLVAILVAGFGPYLRDLFAYAKTTFFWNELVGGPLAWRQASFLLDPDSQPRWLGRAYWGLAVGGAIFILRRDASLRGLAMPVLVFCATTLGITGAMAWHGGTWRGPVPAYVDLFVFPLYACLLGVVVERAAARWAVAARHLGAATAILPWLVLTVWQPVESRPLFRNHVPFLWPPSPTALTRYLQDAIGLVPGGPFRGRVANFAGTEFRPELRTVPFAAQHDYDAMVAYFVRNDHRMYGLWYFGIPTLIENNQFSSPFHHLVAARFLADPDTLHTRPQTTLSHFDERVARRYGVSHVIVDRPLPGRTPALSFAVTPGRDQFVYALERPNVTGAGPVEVSVAPTAAAAVAALARPDFDFEREVVLLEPLPDPGPLSPAHGDALRVHRDGFEVRARAEGLGLLVLPLEFSRCNTARWDEGATALGMVRANLDQTAILFRDRLHGVIATRIGPFTHRGCRAQDLRDADAADLRGAARR